MNRSPLLIVTCALLLSACREPNQPAAPDAAPPPPAAAPAAAAPAAAAAPTPSADAYPSGTVFAAGTLCNIEFLGEQAFAADALPLAGTQALRGWLADESGATPRAIELRFADAGDAVVARVPVVLGLPREDVVAAFPGKSVPLDSGFSVSLAANGLPAGTWRIHLAYSGGEAGDRPTVCDNGRSITIPASP
jgi:hypothetical protein